MNHSKTSAVIAMSREPEALARVVAESDVVLENFGQPRARRLGIDAATLLRNRPDMLALSSSGFGYEGPWSSYRAYAYNLHTSGGLAYLTRSSDSAASACRGEAVLASAPAPIPLAAMLLSDLVVRLRFDLAQGVV